MEGAEVHQRRRRQTDVDDVATGLAQSRDQAVDQHRTGQAAVAPDDDVRQTLLVHQ